MFPLTVNMKQSELIYFSVLQLQRIFSKLTLIENVMDGDG